jgi:Rne/Rng family ribonuclease
MDIMVEELDGGLWVAATDKGRLQGLEVDPGHEAVRWGAIYRAKITRIEKSMDAAFVDLGGGLEGLLHNADVRTKQKDGTILRGGALAIGKTLKAGDIVAVQAKSGYLKHEDEFEFIREDKTPKVSMDITLPGRFLIYAPLMQENQVSSRIRDKKLRENLMKMMREFEPLTGLILRASSEDTQMDILLREAKILKNIWEKIEPALKGSEPGLILDGPDAFQRTIGDQAGNPIDRIEIVTMEQYKKMEEWCQVFGPDLVPKIQPVELDEPEAELALFDFRGLLGDIEDLFQEYGMLRSGGSIIIQQTAALTAIDVNRGGDDRPSMDVNLEAAGEIARQIRLRNLGGIILIDFLKLSKNDDRKRLLKALETIFDTDPCTVQIHGLTALGLLEITRKRRTPPLTERLDNVESLATG